jgi:hypothetical protein
LGWRYVSRENSAAYASLGRGSLNKINKNAHGCIHRDWYIRRGVGTGHKKNRYPVGFFVLLSPSRIHLLLTIKQSGNQEEEKRERKAIKLSSNNEAYPINLSPLFILFDIRFGPAYHKQHSEKSEKTEIG